MDVYEELAKELRKEKPQAGAVPAKVLAVDGLLADVETVDGYEVFDVRLCASGQSESYAVPALQSWVIIAPLQGKENGYYIGATTEVDKYVLSANELVKLGRGDVGLEITSEAASFNEGKNGGLIIIAELVKQLETERARVDGIIQALNNALPATGTPDSGAALIASIKTALAPLTQKADYSSIENEKVMH